MNARDAIFAALERSLGRTAQPADVKKIAAQAQALALESAESRPALLDGDVAEAFEKRLLSDRVVGASVARIAALAEAPQAVARYCEAHGLDPVLALQPNPDLAGLDWSGFTLTPTISGDQTLAVAKARWAIAETGTFVFHSGADTPVLLAFLPMHHICLIERARILPHLEDYALAESGARPPRNVNFITGASGTADIEGALVRGAHGPAFLHALIIEG